MSYGTSNSSSRLRGSRSLSNDFINALFATAQKQFGPTSFSAPLEHLQTNIQDILANGSDLMNPNPNNEYSSRVLDALQAAIVSALDGAHLVGRAEQHGRSGLLSLAMHGSIMWSQPQKGFTKFVTELAVSLAKMYGVSPVALLPQKNRRNVVFDSTTTGTAMGRSGFRIG